MIRLSAEANRQHDSIRADLNKVGRVFGPAAPPMVLAEVETILMDLERKAHALRLQIKRERIQGSVEELRGVAA